jgi:hypothetical protein
VLSADAQPIWDETVVPGIGIRHWRSGFGRCLAPCSIKNRLLRRRVRLLKVIDLADMLRGMRELEVDALAMPAGRETPVLDDSHLVRHVGGHCVPARDESAR